MPSKEIIELRRHLEEAEQRREEAEQLLSEERLQTQYTTLPEFLNACHKHLFLGLAIQDRDSSTKGDPADTDHKLCPRKIQEWRTFPQEQIAVWEDLIDIDFITERHFTPLLVLREAGKEVQQRMLNLELDLGYFQQQTVESPVASVVQQLYTNPQLQQMFHLKGDVTFKNHANTLTNESQIVTEMNSLSITQERPRRSKRLAAKRSTEASRSVSSQGRDKVPPFIIKYQVPHKLSLAHIQAGLQDIELAQVICHQADGKPKDICYRVVAAVIT